LTYPLIGNYGVTPEDVESRRPWLSALLVREYCEEYSNWRAGESLEDYLRQAGIPGMCELDTRALTRHLRTHGTLRGVIRLYESHAFHASLASHEALTPAAAYTAVQDVRGLRPSFIAALLPEPQPLRTITDLAVLSAAP